MTKNRAMLTKEELQRLDKFSVSLPNGRPKKGNFTEDKPVCQKTGCFNYVEHKGDKLCKQHAPQLF